MSAEQESTMIAIVLSSGIHDDYSCAKHESMMIAVVLSRNP